MKLLFELDENNYKGKSKIFKRTAVRSVIFIDNKLVMIKSSKYGECKFIGGGVKTDESHFDTLKREAKEEGGIILNDDIKPLGYVIEKRASTFAEDEIFIMHSYYYLCKIDRYEENNLQDYEIDYDYKLVFVDPLVAYINNLLIGFDNPNIKWNKRDTCMLDLIVNNKIANFN
ncbi:TPA: NUDIX domain-containing protein [bacterium]|nr:NUDIX domain-containing protein [bacterium]